MKKNDNIDNMISNIKRKPLNGKKTIIAIFVAIVFTVYCTYLLIKLLANPTNTFIVENGKIYQEETTYGYILRDEQLVENTNSASKIVQLKTEGKKVANGEAIYRYALENEDELNEQIKQIDIQIQEALENESTLFSTDIKLLETQIEQKLENVYESTNIQRTEQYKKEISDSITKKAKIAGELTPNGSYVKQLISDRTNYEKQLSTNSQYVYASKSGIVSYKVDELENVLTVADFGYLNKEFLDNLHLKTSQIIASSSNSAKIIDNFKCYITCTSKTNQALDSQVGNKLKLRLPNSEEVSAKIVHKVNESDDEVLLVFEIEQCVEDLINHRKISFDIIWWSDSGIKIPNSAIHYEGDFAYVIRNRAGYQDKILVKILRQNENYAIVENYSTAELEEAGYDVSTLTNKKSISMYDEIIIKED